MNWWEELELETETEKRLQAEVERLRAVNARLLAACEEAYEYIEDRPGAFALKVTKQLGEVIALGRGQFDQPTGPKLPGLE